MSEAVAQTGPLGLLERELLHETDAVARLDASMVTVATTVLTVLGLGVALASAFSETLANASVLGVVAALQVVICWQTNLVLTQLQVYRSKHSRRRVIILYHLNEALKPDSINAPPPIGAAAYFAPIVSGGDDDDDALIGTDHHMKRDHAWKHVEATQATWTIVFGSVFFGLAGVRSGGKPVGVPWQSLFFLIYAGYAVAFAFSVVDPAASRAAKGAAAYVLVAGFAYTLWGVWLFCEDRCKGECVGSLAAFVGLLVLLPTAFVFVVAHNAIDWHA